MLFYLLLSELILFYFTFNFYPAIYYFFLCLQLFVFRRFKKKNWKPRICYVYKKNWEKMVLNPKKSWFFLAKIIYFFGIFSFLYFYIREGIKNLQGLKIKNSLIQESWKIMFEFLQLKSWKKRCLSLNRPV